jgi:signal transduction histidine kinase
MIRKLRLKFIAIIAIIMSVILLVEIFSINIVTRKIGIMQTESYLSQIANSEKFNTIDGIDNIPPDDVPSDDGEDKNINNKRKIENNIIPAKLSFVSQDSDVISAEFDENQGDWNYYDRVNPEWERPWWDDDYDNPDYQQQETQPAVKETTPKQTTTRQVQTTKTTKTTTKITTKATTKSTTNTTKTTKTTVKTTQKTTKSTTKTSTKTTTTTTKLTSKTTTKSTSKPTQTTAKTEKNTEKISTTSTQITNNTNKSDEITTDSTKNNNTESSTELTSESESESESVIESTEKIPSHDNNPPPEIKDKNDKDFFGDRENKVQVDYFAIIFDKNKEIYRYDNVQDDNSMTDEQFEYLAYKAVNAENYTDLISIYQYYRLEKDYGYVVVFTNKSSENVLMKKMMMISIFVTLIAMLILLGVAVILSGWTVKPVKEAFANQKQFISDASHELKTPLTVISANTDLLESEIGDNKWLGYIKGQTERMRTLVYELLDLSRMDSAYEPHKAFAHFSLSNAVNNATLPFEGSAFEQQKNLMIDIQENINYFGNEKQIKQLTAIFIDNALKYSNEKGNIRVTLKKEHDKTILEFFNTGCTIKDSERDKIFERFYRSDSSRARQTGGYGLGLAIAKSIMESHKMKFSVDSVENAWIKFTIVM